MSTTYASGMMLAWQVPFIGLVPIIFSFSGNFRPLSTQVGKHMTYMDRPVSLASYDLHLLA